MYTYIMWGLSIESDILLDAVESDIKNCDVSISRLTDFIKQTKFEYLDQGLDAPIEFKTSEGIIFYIYNGREIYYAMSDNTSVELVKVYLLGTAFAILMMQRNIFCLHGGFVQYKNKGILVVGESGAGKSTFVGKLIQIGALLLSDDVTRIDVEDKELIGYSSYPSQKLWPSSSSFLSLENSELKSIPELQGKQKRNVSSCFFSGKQKIHLICLLSVKEGLESVQVKQVFGSSRLPLLIENTYRGNVARSSQFNFRHFEWLSQVTPLAEMVCFDRPKHINSLDILCAYLLNYLGVD